MHDMDHYSMAVQWKRTRHKIPVASGKPSLSYKTISIQRLYTKFKLLTIYISW